TLAQDESIPTDEEQKRRSLDAIRRHFRPEFLNRIDEIIVFRRLQPSDLRKVVDIQIQKLSKLLEEKGVAIQITDRAKDQLAKEGFDPIYGARPLRRLVQTRIQNELATRLLNGEVGEGDVLQVDAVADGFTFEKLKPVSAARSKKAK